MTIIGFNFTKINIEKTKALQGPVNINNNVSIKNIEESDFSLGSSKQKGLKFIVEFKSKYEPSIGSINLVGEVLFLEDAKKVEDISKSWKENKKIPKEIMTPIMNTALNRCNIQALILSQQMNLPPPVPLPKVGKEQKKA